MRSRPALSRARAQTLRLALGALLALACACNAAPDTTRDVTVRLPEGTHVSLTALRYAASSHLLALRLDDSGRLQLQTDGSAFQLHIRGLCPVDVAAQPQPGTTQELEAKRLFQMPSFVAQVGYDAAFELTVTPGCAAAAQGQVKWRQLEGLPLRELVPSERGLRLRGRTLPLAAYFSGALPHGVVPISPRTQGRYVFEALGDTRGDTQRSTVTLTSSARATGISSLAVSQRVMLGGEGWHVTRLPPRAHAQLELRSGVATFAPDVPGKFALADALGHTLELQALRHDLTPLDCARSECHAALSDAALTSPMSRAFELPFARGQAQLSEQRCMLECHVVGEPGLKDGGFVDLSAVLEYRPGRDVPSGQLPHALQRLAGVRCTSCHGPGAVPSHDGRARILRAAVCATCHDAPAAYTHVQEWQASRMARADAAPETRTDPSCARCHTTGGFLHQQAIRVREDRSRDPDDAVVGISCAACHAPHGAHVGRALVRDIEPPASLPDPTTLRGTASHLCAQCHAPLADQLSPAASSAALWLGRVSLPLALGAGELSGEAPHAQIAEGCIGCHGKRPDAPRRHTDHSFAVDPKLCTSCHQDPSMLFWAQEKQELMTRAQALLMELSKRCGDAPPSAGDPPPHARGNNKLCKSRNLARARYAMQLVREDRGAFEHNARFVRQLLRDAAAALAK
jgi:hypothetical protein